MSDRNLVTTLVLKLQDTASAGVNRFRKTLGGLDNTATRVGGILATYFGGRAIADFFGTAIGSAKDFERQMSIVAAVTGASAEEQDRLKKAADEAGASTQYTAAQSGSALESLGRAGFNATQSIETLPTVLALATANELELAEAAGIVADQVSQFALATSEASRASDVLTKTAQESNTNVQQVAIAMRDAAPFARAAGLSIEQTAAIIGNLAKTSLRGQRAGTGIKNVLAQLSDPATKSRKALAELGIETGDLLTVIRGLQQAGPAGEKALLAFGLEAGPTIRNLVSQGADALEEFEEKLYAAGGASQEAADLISSDLEGSLKGLESAWDAMRRRLVEPLLDPIADSVRKLTDRIAAAAGSDGLKKFAEALVEGFENASTAAIQFVGSIDFSAMADRLSAFAKGAGQSLRTLSALLQTTSSTISIISNVFTGAVKSVGAAVSGIIAAGGELVLGWDRLLNAVGLRSDEFTRKREEQVSALWDLSRRYVDGVVEDVGDISDSWNSIGDAISGSAKATQGAADAASKSAEAQVQAIGKVTGAQREQAEAEAAIAEANGIAADAAERKAETAQASIAKTASELGELSKVLDEVEQKIAGDGEIDPDSVSALDLARARDTAKTALNRGDMAAAVDATERAARIVEALKENGQATDQYLSGQLALLRDISSEIEAGLKPAKVDIDTESAVEAARRTREAVQAELDRSPVKVRVEMPQLPKIAPATGGSEGALLAAKFGGNNYATGGEI